MFSCLLRIIDSFGTEPAFNYDVYAKAHHLKTQWGMQNLNPQQFFTMFRQYLLSTSLVSLYWVTSEFSNTYMMWKVVCIGQTGGQTDRHNTLQC